MRDGFEGTNAEDELSNKLDRLVGYMRGAIVPVASDGLESRKPRVSHFTIERKTVGTGLEAVEIGDEVRFEMSEPCSEFSSMLALSRNNLAKSSSLVCADFCLESCDVVEASNFDEDLFHARGTILKVDHRVECRRDLWVDGRLDLINARSIREARNLSLPSRLAKASTVEMSTGGLSRETVDAASRGLTAGSLAAGVA